MERTRTYKLSEHIGKKVTISGWVDVRRDHGKLVFVDLRDATGKVQVVFNPKVSPEAHTAVEAVRPEWVVSITGNLKKRPEKLVNKEEANGAYELEATELVVVTKAETPPFDVTGEGVDVGEEHRLSYRYLDLRRPRMQTNIRNRAKVIKFIRDFLTDKDFVEVETPILTKSTPEGARDYVVPSRQYPGEFYALPQSPQQFKQLLMVAGFERYFQIARCFRDEDTRGDRQAEFTQLDIEISFPTQDTILELIESMYTEITKRLYPEKHISQTPWPRLDYADVTKKYKTDRPDLRKDKNDSNELAFTWVLNFPLFEEETKDGDYAPSHHMFTAPKETDVAKLESDPSSVESYQHDLVLNGYEVGGGSIRIHDPVIQEKIFDLIGFSKERKQQFDHMLKAFTYGVPPHGGIAMGLDRFIMLLQDESSIREVIAFPKTGEGRDLTMGAPSKIEPGQLDELGIKIVRDDKKKD